MKTDGPKTSMRMYALMYAGILLAATVAMVAGMYVFPEYAKPIGKSVRTVPVLVAILYTHQSFVRKNMRVLGHSEYVEIVAYSVAITCLLQMAFVGLAMAGGGMALSGRGDVLVLAIVVIFSVAIAVGLPFIGFSALAGGWLLQNETKRQRK